MTNQRSFLPNDTAILVATSDDKRTVAVSSPDWRAERDAYNKERAIKSLMMNRTGVCG